MTSFDRFERSLPLLLDELATPRVPDYFDDLLTRTAATRQRPGWRFPERWLPMSTLTGRFAAFPRVPWRLGALVALLAIAALVAALVAGSIINRTPAPYGPAANGRIVFVDQAGAIVAGDPVTGTTTTLIAELGGSLPLYSQDGTRLAYIKLAAGAKFDLIVANADGANPVQLTVTPISEPSYIGWSARGERLLVVDAGGRLLLFATGQAGEPVILSDELEIPTTAIGLQYNFQSSHGFRPPTGEEILFTKKVGGEALMAVKPDGTGLRTLVDRTTPGLAYTMLTGAQWSPDGSKVLLLVEPAELRDIWHLYVVNADGTGLRRLGQNPLDGLNSPMWSPDGTRIAFQYWTQHVDDDGQDFHPIGVIDVETGVLKDVGPIIYNGYVSWEWSPDGSSILEVPQEGFGEMLIVNATTGLWKTAPWRVDEPSSWQRVAP